MNEAQATGEPIWIDCEGSGCPTHFPDEVAVATGMCQMCGEWVVIDNRAHAIRHKRDDIIARVKRGDFG